MIHAHCKVISLATDAEDKFLLSPSYLKSTLNIYLFILIIIFLACYSVYTITTIVYLLFVILSELSYSNCFCC